jgi:5'-methylthioadenosine phosphorylase
VKITGIIGGSGLYSPDMMENMKSVEIDTPYGNTSSPLYCGQIAGKDVALIARHGKNHCFSPSEVNYRANIYALHKHGAAQIIATTACGSLRTEIKRGDFVILDQFIDFTRSRKNSFHDKFETGAVHAQMADPFDQRLREAFLVAARALNYPVHATGTVVTIEGPRFSTRAESRMFKAWGADVINMSVATETCLANELKIPYAAIAMSTDYDCWKEDEAPVSWDEILNIFKENVSKVKDVLIKVIEKEG